jgi:hypothetical protein
MGWGARVLSDKEEQILQKLEIVGLALYRCVKKNRIREYVMSRNYAISALAEVRKLMESIRNGGKNGKQNGLS